MAANTLLFLWQEGKLTKRQLMLANLLNASLPAYFLHLHHLLRGLRPHEPGGANVFRHDPTGRCCVALG
ncbi:hypothetical protein DFAR_2850002 [Desulfarculales bacterium]